MDDRTTAKILGKLCDEQDRIREMSLLALDKIKLAEKPFWPIWWDEVALAAEIASHRR